MMENCEYNCIKLLHKLSCISWFIKKHALEDAKKSENTKLYELLQYIEKDMEKHIAELKKVSSCLPMK